MPIEIRELVIRASLARREDREEGKSTKMVTSEDLKELQEQRQQSRKSIPRSVRQEIIRECLEQMQAWLEQQRLR